MTLRQTTWTLHQTIGLVQNATWPQKYLITRSTRNTLSASSERTSTRLVLCCGRLPDARRSEVMPHFDVCLRIKPACYGVDSLPSSLLAVVDSAIYRMLFFNRENIDSCIHNIIIMYYTTCDKMRFNTQWFMKETLHIFYGRNYFFDTILMTANGKTIIIQHIN